MPLVCGDLWPSERSLWVVGRLSSLPQPQRRASASPHVCNSLQFTHITGVATTSAARAVKRLFNTEMLNSWVEKGGCLMKLQAAHHRTSVHAAHHTLRQAR